MPTKKVKTQIVRCVVAGKNFDLNESDFIFVTVLAKLNRNGFYNRGKINAAAKKWAENNFNFKSYLVFIGDDVASVAFASNAFDWKTATIVEIQ